MQIAQTLAPETRALADLFIATEIGGVVTFAAMTAAIGQDIATRRHLMPSALSVAARESGAIFGSVRRVGYKRIAPEDAHILGAHVRRRIRRSAKRAGDAMLSAITKANHVPEPAKARAYTEINSLALVRHIASDKEVTVSISEPKAEPVGVLMRRFAKQMGIVE